MTNTESTKSTNAIAVTPGIDANPRMNGVFDLLLRARESIFRLLTRSASGLESLARQLRNGSENLDGHLHDLIETGRDGTTASLQLVNGLPRFTRVVETAIRIAAEYRLVEVKSTILSAEGRRAELEAAHRKGARLLQTLCLELGAGVLKLGQFLSCRMDLLPAAYVEALSCLQDRAPSAPPDEIKSLVEAELGRPLEAVFRHFNPEPLAAASLAQVHAAVLLDGTPVAVKVQRPGVDELIRADMLAVRAAARILAGTLPQLDLAAMAAELDRSIREELDFRQEAENLMELRRHFQGDPRVLLPNPHPGGITRRLLILEHMDGERLTGYLEMRRQEGEAGARRMAELLGTLLDSFATQILRHGFYQADPHPGNFLVTPDDRLVMLDMGNVGRISPSKRRTYARLVTAFIARDQAATAQCLADLGFRAVGDEDDFLLRYAELFMEGFRFESGEELGQVDVEERLERILQLSRARMKVKVPDDFVLLARVLISLSGLLMHYRPSINFVAILTPHLLHALQEEPVESD